LHACRSTLEDPPPEKVFAGHPHSLLLLNKRTKGQKCKKTEDKKTAYHMQIDNEEFSFPQLIPVP
jgi:hypothetical protein